MELPEIENLIEDLRSTDNTDKKNTLIKVWLYDVATIDRNNQPFNSNYVRQNIPDVQYYNNMIESLKHAIENDPDNTVHYNYIITYINRTCPRGSCAVMGGRKSRHSRRKTHRRKSHRSHRTRRTRHRR